MSKSNVYILYHANCTDGTGAKYAAWRKYGDDGANYIPVAYGKEPPEELDENSEVYIVDFSYPRDVLEALQKRCKSVVVLDHHKTAEEALRGLKGCYFDMKKSGAVLAWEYFHPGVPIPQLLLHVQDRDLWNWNLPGTKEVLSGLALTEGGMGLWRYYDNAEGVQFLYNSGVSIVAYEQLLLKSKIKHAKIVWFSVNGVLRKAGVINSTELASEVGNLICLDEKLEADFAIVYSLTKDNDVLLSFRSVGDFDVSHIAKAFGGGGHKNASGARMNFSQLQWLITGNLGVYYDDEDNTWKVDE